MKKKYLKTIEDVLALKDTDTKIYAEKDEERYYQFVKGVLCCFSINNDHVCIGDWVTLGMNLYTLEEEPEQEATEADVGKLCWFFNEAKEGVDIRKPFVAILWRIDNDFKHPFIDDATCTHWEHCRRLSPTEVAEITGYKVEKAE